MGAIKNFLAGVTFATAVAGCGSIKDAANTDEKSAHTPGQEYVDKALTPVLKDTLAPFADALYDEETKQSYLFAPLPQDPDTLALAAAHNVFYAKKDTLNVYMPKVKNAHDAQEILKKQGFTPIVVANDVYQITTAGKNIQEVKAHLAQQKNIGAVSYEYYAHLQACPTRRNDQEAYYGQLYLGLKQRVDTGYGTAVPMHSIDSVAVTQMMHTPSTAANPNIKIVIIDSGINVANQDFAGNVVHAYNYVTNTTGNDVTNSNHGSKVTELAAAKANNNYGGVGVAHDFPIESLDVGTDAGLTTSAIYAALDRVYAEALAHPDQKQVVNMSFSGGDAIQHTKIQQSYNLQNATQVFFVGAGGNTGGTTIQYPAGRPEVFAVGATNNIDPARARRSGSNTGAELDFMADGQNAWTMDASGNFALGNGTSFAAPIFTGAVAHLIAQDPNADYMAVYNRFKESAKDLQTTGFDVQTGRGYAKTFSALKYAVIEDVPTSFDCAGNASFTYAFTPKFYNSAADQTVRECRYPNGQVVPFTTDANGVITFHAVFNTNNGFSATNPNINRLTYTFETVGNAGCSISILTKPITFTNLGTLGLNDLPSLEGNYYPNPVSDVLTVENFPKDVQDIASVTVSDMLGRTIYLAEFTVQGDAIRIDYSNVPANTFTLLTFRDKAGTPLVRPIKIVTAGR